MWITAAGLPRGNECDRREEALWASHPVKSIWTLLTLLARPGLTLLRSPTLGPLNLGPPAGP